MSLQALAALPFVFVQRQRNRIDAVAQSRWPRSVFKHVAKVRFATAADHFRADHAVGSIVVLFDRLLGERRSETRPTTAGVKFCFRTEQGLPAAHTFICPPRLGGCELPRERRLGTLLPGHMVLIRRELRLPFAVRFANFLAHIVPFVPLWHTFYQYQIQRTALTFPRSTSIINSCLPARGALVMDEQT